MFSKISFTNFFSRAGQREEPGTAKTSAPPQSEGPLASVTAEQGIAEAKRHRVRLRFSKGREQLSKACKEVVSGLTQKRQKMPEMSPRQLNNLKQPSTGSEQVSFPRPRWGAANRALEEIEGTFPIGGITADLRNMVKGPPNDAEIDTNEYPITLLYKALLAIARPNAEEMKKYFDKPEDSDKNFEELMRQIDNHPQKDSVECKRLLAMACLLTPTELGVPFHKLNDLHSPIYENPNRDATATFTVLSAMLKTARDLIPRSAQGETRGVDRRAQEKLRGMASSIVAQCKSLIDIDLSQDKGYLAGLEGHWERLKDTVEKDWVEKRLDEQEYNGVLVLAWLLNPTPLGVPLYKLNSDDFTMAVQPYDNRVKKTIELLREISLTISDFQQMPLSQRRASMGAQEKFEGITKGGSVPRRKVDIAHPPHTHRRVPRL